MRFEEFVRPVSEADSQALFRHALRLGPHETVRFDATSDFLFADPRD